MSRAVADILNSLMPGHNGSLPSPLVELALCLLAQSRSQASTLKAEEEIARSYVCAHLACERLKRSLNLSKVQPRPPCPPRIYQKLYRHFDTSLRAGTIRRGRPPKSKTHEPVPKGPPCDSGSILGRQARTTRQTAPRELPSWIMPAIRQLCSGMDAPAAPPHVFAGVSSILTLPSPNDSHNQIELLASVDNKPRIHALIISVYLLVAMLLRGRQINNDERIKETDQALRLMNGMETSSVEKEMAKVEDVDNWLAKLHDEGWLDLDWHQNIPRGSGLQISSSVVDVVQQLGDGAEQTEPKLPFTRAYYIQDAKVSGNTLQPGLGTMMQENVDYLNSRRRADYDKWRATMMARIKERRSEQDATAKA